MCACVCASANAINQKETRSPRLLACVCVSVGIGSSLLPAAERALARADGAQIDTPKQRTANEKLSDSRQRHLRGSAALSLFLRSVIVAAAAAEPSTNK